MANTHHHQMCTDWPCTIGQEISEVRFIINIMFDSVAGEGSQSSKSVFIPGLLGGIKPGAGRIGKQIADECMEQLKWVYA